jgi:resuscitation-promoting factor RpfB
VIQRVPSCNRRYENAHLVVPRARRRCDPNYSGCVPIASDVDCAGGGGNGPAYVSGTVRVIGSDIYDLDRDRDRDGDGIGCD